MQKEILGIMREKKFSPNHIENDAEIMKATAAELNSLGHKVKLVYESKFVNTEYDFPAYFSMGRNEKTLDKLSNLTEAGALVINSSEGVYNSFRETLTPKMQDAQILMPNTIVFDTDKFEKSYFEQMKSKKVWLKRENHSLHREDVTPIYSLAECECTIREFQKRGIKQCLLQEHVIGSEIKFYGLKDTDFFHWFYVNGEPHHKFNETELKSISARTSSLLNLDIYGGDAIITADGSISIIDFNDWPSFAPVRAVAAKNIAQLIDTKIKETAV